MKVLCANSPSEGSQTIWIRIIIVRLSFSQNCSPGIPWSECFVVISLDSIPWDENSSVVRQFVPPIFELNEIFLFRNARKKIADVINILSKPSKSGVWVSFPFFCRRRRIHVPCMDLGNQFVIDLLVLLEWWWGICHEWFGLVMEVGGGDWEVALRRSAWVSQGNRTWKGGIWWIRLAGGAEKCAHRED